LRLEQLEDRCVPAAVAWTGGAGNFDWDNAANWDAGRVPIAGDDAYINTAGITVVHSAGVDDAVISLHSQAALYLSGGSLSVASTSTIDSDFTLSTATLGGTGDVTIAGLFTWGGRLTGTPTGGVLPTLTAEGGIHILNLNPSSVETLNARVLNSLG